MKTKLLYFIILFITACTSNELPRINAEVQRVTEQNDRHQAFTDLVYFDNQFFLTFREGDRHAAGSKGVIKLMRSVDGYTWTDVKQFNVPETDLRDPKFSVNGNQLFLYIHGVSYKGNELLKLNDYRFNYLDKWSITENVVLDNKQQTTKKIGGNEAWPWRVTSHSGVSYSVGYNGHDIFGIYKSTDGLFFENIKNLTDIKELPSEATIRFTDKGDLIMLIRRNAGSAIVAKYDLISSKVSILGQIPIHNFGGPNFLIVDKDKILFSGRAESGKLVLGVFNLKTGKSKIISDLQTGGDATYPGMLIMNNVLWISYYSSHETLNGSSIYVAKIQIEDLSL